MLCVELNPFARFGPRELRHCHHKPGVYVAAAGMQPCLSPRTFNCRYNWDRNHTYAHIWDVTVTSRAHRPISVSETLSLDMVSTARGPHAGFDLGVLNPSLQQIGVDLNLSPVALSCVVAILLLSAAVGALGSGKVHPSASNGLPSLARLASALWLHALMPQYGGTQCAGGRRGRPAAFAALGNAVLNLRRPLHRRRVGPVGLRNPAVRPRPPWIWCEAASRLRGSLTSCLPNLRREPLCGRQCVATRTWQCSHCNTHSGPRAGQAGRDAASLL